MATVKHIKIYNANYDAATDYLTMQHDEFTNKPILEENQLMTALRQSRTVVIGMAERSVFIADYR